MQLATSSATAYVWEDPGGSLHIEIGLDVVEKLNAAVRRGLGNGLRGTEIGGVLLGRQLPGERRVFIDDFEVWPCLHLRGDSYTLTSEEGRRLAAHLARRKTGNPVGYFRSHTRPGLYLDQDDFGVVTRCFADTSDVVLLVRPSREGPAVGGFFFWEESEMERRSSYRQFPFDRERLLVGDFPLAYHPEPVTPVKQPERAAPALTRQLVRTSWLAIPALAACFLIAGLFLSQKNASKPVAVSPVRASRQARLQPVPQAVEPAPPSPHPAVTAAPPVSIVHPIPLEKPAIQAEVPPPPIQARPLPPLKRSVVTPPGSRVAPPVQTARVEPPPAKPASVEPPPARTEALPAPPALPSEKPKLAGALHPVSPPPPVSTVEVSYETPHSGLFRRALHRITALGESDGNEYVPPAPVHKVTPPIPRGEDEGSADVKVFIDEFGQVSRAQLVGKRNSVSELAVDAARQWRFTPARKRDKSVSSELVLHFRYGHVGGET